MILVKLNPFEDGGVRYNVQEELPDFIYVAGKKVEVKVMDNVGEIEDWGYFSEDLNCIFIHPKCFLENKVSETIKHEAVHAVLRYSGLFYHSLQGNLELEEAIVRCIENLYLPCLENIDGFFKKS